MTAEAFNSRAQTMSLGPDPAQQQPEEEQFLSTFFCRALFDYQTDNDSSLSFRRDDIIEVLTRLESGWWDGLLGQERGWFPSNYVTVISDQEADAALAAAEAAAAAQLEFQTVQATVGHTHTLELAHPQNVVASQEWDQPLATPHAVLQPNTHTLSHSQNTQHHTNVIYPQQNGTAPGIGLQGDGLHPRSGTQSSDFWVPQVSADGRIYYVNTQTGQQSRDLPLDIDQDIPEDVATINGPRNGAGFGVPRRASTPEPWKRVLADDGLSYYFVNKADGTISMTMPPASAQQPHPANGPSQTDLSPAGPPPHVPTRVPSQTGVASGNDSDRYSVHSDDSDVQPALADLGRERSASSLRVPASADSSKSNITQLSHSLSSDLTPAERSAQELQQALAAPPPDSVNQLAVVAREAIGNVVQYIQTRDNVSPGRYGHELNDRVLAVVYSVRNLLYVSATPSSQITNNLYPRDTRHTRTTTPSQALQAHLKPAQRKVAGTLSKLVLSTLAVQYEANHSQAADKPMRMEGDAGELDRAVVAFVTEVQRFLEQNAQSSDANVIKRLYGVFEPEHVGLGLVGGGAAAGWKGFGWLALEGEDEAPNRQLSVEVITELKGLVAGIEAKRTTLADTKFDVSGEPDVVTHCRDFLSRLSECIDYISTIHVARHVDIDGFNVDASATPNRDLYLQTVDKAQRLVRKLEVAVQAVYDEGASILMALQILRSTTADPSASWHQLLSLTVILQTNLGIVNETFEALLSVGHDQAELGQGEYNGSIEWRMSRVSIIESRIAAVITLPRIAGASSHSETETEDEVVNMELAFRRPDPKAKPTGSDQLSIGSSTLYRNRSQSSEASLEPLNESFSELDGRTITPTWSRDGLDSVVNGSGTVTPRIDLDSDIDRFLEADNSANPKSPPRASKLRKILGDDAPQAYIDKVNADFKKWYLRSDHAPEDLQTDPEGTVKGGTIQALVERLTTHDAPDTKYNKTFLMTYKSFTTTNELFDLLVARFWTQPPENLAPAELDEWKRLKQHVVRARVLNTFKSMIVDNDILEEEDSFIFERMKEFISNEDVQSFAAAKQLGIHIERAQRGDARLTTSTQINLVPPSILPKTSKKGEMKLSDVDPLEMARQLTLMESHLYQKIRPIECLQRSRDQKGDVDDNISLVIQFANKIANWVAETILAKDESRRRASVVKNFIGIADRCKGLHNFPSMIAIVAGLNTTPIRRLKRTWEQVPQRFMTMLSQCETMMNTNKNFGNYRHKLSTIVAPCVPFIGVFLTQLTFINENPNMIGPNLVNFRKRQKAAEVIEDIKRWQLTPYSLNSVPSVVAFVEDSLRPFDDGRDLSDYFWNLSLEREPREREDEKMARLLQESGFL